MSREMTPDGWELMQQPPYEMWDKAIGGWWCRVVRYNKDTYETHDDEYKFFVARNGYRLDSPKFKSPELARTAATLVAQCLSVDLPRGMK